MVSAFKVLNKKLAYPQAVKILFPYRRVIVLAFIKAMIHFIIFMYGVR